VNPLKLKAGDAGLLVLHPLDPVLCDKFVDCAATGRFSALGTDHSAVVFVGVIKSVEVREICCVVLWLLSGQRFNDGCSTQLISAELLKAPRATSGGSGAPSTTARIASGSEPEAVLSESEELSPKSESIEPSIAVMTAIAAARSEHELCGLFGDLLAACGSDRIGICGVSSAAVPLLRVAKPAIMSAAIERREEAGSVWTPDVAKVFGKFLKAIL
jgi:hypothetical protein